MTIPASWRAAVLSYECPKCGARAGQRCVTLRDGTPTEGTHVGRALGAFRCPRCGSRIAADSLPGDLCPRCALVRSLEVERVTHHRRRDP